MKRSLLWLTTVGISAIAFSACDLQDKSDGDRSSDNTPGVVECDHNFCEDNPQGIDCISRCELDPAVDGCWYECGPGEESDCWTLECSEPGPPTDEPEPGADTTGGEDCDHNFCDENPDGIDCISRCELDPAVDGCWHACEPGQETDCWTLECNEPEPPAGESGPEPSTTGGQACTTNFCEDDVDIVDCVAPCELDPSVDGCWYECEPDEESDCWTAC